MKKTIIFVIAVAYAVLSACAAQYAYSLLVNMKGGNTVAYKFVDEPVASIVGDDLQIKVQSTGEKVLHPISQLENLTFSSGAVDAISDILAPGDVSFGLAKDLLEAAGLESGTQVIVYDLSGKRVASAKADANGNVCIRLSQLASGVYVVNAGKNSFKFCK